MLTPERFNILQRAFGKAKCSGLYDNIHPPPILNLASELVGLITRKDTATSILASQKRKDSFSRMLPPPTSSPLYKNGGKKKWHPPLTMPPRSLSTGLNTQEIRPLGCTATPYPPSSLVSLSLPSHLP
jgi:hypothetical protein